MFCVCTGVLVVEKYMCRRESVQQGERLGGTIMQAVGNTGCIIFLVMVIRAVEGVQKQCVGMGRGFSLTEFFLLAVQED